MSNAEPASPTPRGAIVFKPNGPPNQTSRSWAAGALLTIGITGAAASLVACGASSPSAQSSSTPTTSRSQTPAAPRLFDDSEVWKFIGATKDTRFGGTNHWMITLKSGATCDVSMILSTASAVNLYASAGDPVATNTARWMGIRTSSYEGATASCVKELNKRLANFK